MNVSETPEVTTERRAAFVTYNDTVTRDVSHKENHLVEKYLNKHGISVDHVTIVTWDDSQINWSQFDMVIISTTWDYHRRPAEFRKWLESMKNEDTLIYNSVETILWNMDKHYLLELQNKGVPIPQTYIVDKQKFELKSITDFMVEHGLNECVVKPCISASCTDTVLLNSRDEAIAKEQDLMSLFKARDVILQKYINEIKTTGEYSLMFFNKIYSHTVIKVPEEGEFRLVEGCSMTSASPPARVMQVATSALDCISFDVLYARVDVIQRENGQVVLMELELIEPMIFLGYFDHGAQMFGDAILEKLNQKLT